MRPHQSSQTAEYMALFRALESAQSPSRRLFDDPYARHFLRPSLRFTADLARMPFFGGLIPWVIDRRWPGARTSGVARTKLIDDLLMRALHDGVKQVVILGAGFDCRAYRLTGMDRVRVIEVDHPDTQQVKRAQLRHVLGSLPDHVQFVALDFNRQPLEHILAASEFDKTCQTFFIWEGVTNYLSAAAVDATFRAMRALAEDSLVLFTYVDKAVLNVDDRFTGTTQLNRTLQRAGERWMFGFDPTELAVYLDQRGFRLVCDVGSVDYRSQYLGRSRRLLRGYEFYRVALAASQSI